MRPGMKVHELMEELERHWEDATPFVAIRRGEEVWLVVIEKVEAFSSYVGVDLSPEFELPVLVIDERGRGRVDDANN